MTHGSGRSSSPTCVDTPCSRRSEATRSPPSSRRSSRTIAREIVEARGGTLLELRGDEALCVFSSTREAIRAAVDLQQRFVEETLEQPELPLTVGIGLDAGEAVPVEGGYRGGGPEPRGPALRPGSSRRDPRHPRGDPPRAADRGREVRGSRLAVVQGHLGPGRGRPRRSRGSRPGRTPPAVRASATAAAEDFSALGRRRRDRGGACARRHLDPAALLRR